MFTWFLGILVLALLIWQAKQAITSLDTATFWTGVQSKENYWRITLVLFLMPVNWLLETRKWQLLLRPFLPWSFGKCLHAVLAGLSISAATPNRIGEIGGRILVAQKQEIPGVLASSLIGSMVQWMVFLTIAFPALLWVSADLLKTSFQAWRWVLLPIGPFGILVLWLGGKPLLLRILQWINKRWNLNSEPLTVALKKLNFTTLLAAYGWATLRFLTYVTQLYLLLCVFGLSLPLFWGLAGIAAIYFVQAGLPLPPGVNLLTRAELGILLWGPSPETTAAALAAFGTLFLVNVLLPALPAYWLIVKKIKK